MRSPWLGTTLERTGLDLEDVYAGARRSWTQLGRKAGHVPNDTEDTALLRTMGRLLPVDDPERLRAWCKWLALSSPPKLLSLSADEQALIAMLVVSVGDARRPVAEMDDELTRIWSYSEVRRELTELLHVLDQRTRRRTHRRMPNLTGPLSVHATYSRREVVAALGVMSKGRFREHREGPLYVPARALDAMFVTLDKSDDVSKPSIRYADYPISPTHFHWESQNRIHDDTPTGRRYVERGSSVVFFVRERPSDSRGEAMPFRFLGKATYLTHQSARPMQIEWHLDTPMPTSLWTVGQRVAR
jgi:hypothetical protein